MCCRSCLLLPTADIIKTEERKRPQNINFYVKRRLKDVMPLITRMVCNEQPDKQGVCGTERHTLERSRVWKIEVSHPNAWSMVESHGVKPAVVDVAGWTKLSSHWLRLLQHNLLPFLCKNLPCPLQNHLKALSSLLSIFSKPLNTKGLNLVLDILPSTTQSRDFGGLMKLCFRQWVVWCRCVCDCFSYGEEIGPCHVLGAEC